jgi:hypothetical protein
VCEKDTGHPDPCIRPLLAALNDGGLPTAASCCGHGRALGAISFADGSEHLILPDWVTARRVDGVLTAAGFRCMTRGLG